MIDCFKTVMHTTFHLRKLQINCRNLCNKEIQINDNYCTKGIYLGICDIHVWYTLKKEYYLIFLNMSS